MLAVGRLGSPLTITVDEDDAESPKKFVNVIPKEYVVRISIELGIVIKFEEEAILFVKKAVSAVVSPFSARTVHTMLLHGLPPLPVEAEKSIGRSLQAPIWVGTKSMIDGFSEGVGRCTITDNPVLKLPGMYIAWSTLSFSQSVLCRQAARTIPSLTLTVSLGLRDVSAAALKIILIVDKLVQEHVVISASVKVKSILQGHVSAVIFA